MTVSTRTLDKMRPDQLKADRDVDGYFRELERILAVIGTTGADVSTTSELTQTVNAILATERQQNNSTLINYINQLGSIVLAAVRPANDLRQRIEQLEAELLAMRQQANASQPQNQINEVTAYTFGAR